VNLIELVEVKQTSFTRLNGESGTSYAKPAKLASENSESPNKFEATTLT